MSAIISRCALSWPSARLCRTRQPCIYSKSSKLRTPQADTTTRRPMSKRAQRLNRIVGALILSKLVLWTPVILFLVLRTVGINHLAVGYTGSICLYLCSVTNPLMYGATNYHYQQCIRQIFRRHLGHRVNQHIQTAAHMTSKHNQGKLNKTVSWSPLCEV